MEKKHPNKIILFDSSSQIENIESLIKEDLDYQIISLDYESHRHLQNHGVIHKISDEFVTEEELTEIEEKSYVFSKWASDPAIADYLNYEGINIPNLFYREFHYFLIPFLKKFLEISKICEQNKQSEFFASKNIESIIKLYTNSVHFFVSNTTGSSKQVFDSLKYEFRLGNQSLTLKISKKNYRRLKKILETILNSFLGLQNLNSSKKNILLVEFDTLRYRDLLIKSSKSNLNVVLFNRRRPTAWNLESFSILRKSKCFSASNITPDKKIELKIPQEIKKIQNKANEIFNTSKLEDFFTINGYSFWRPLKPVLQNFTNDWISDAVKEIEISKSLLTNYKFKAIFILYESGITEQVILNLAKQFQTPVFLMTHGLSYETLTVPYLQRRKFDGVDPIHSTKVIVWGELLRGFLKRAGLVDNKIEVLGSAIYDDVFERKTKVAKNNKTEFILLATTSPIRNMVRDLTVKTMTNYETTIKKICEIVCGLNKKLVIKQHPFMEELDVAEFIKDVDGDVTIRKQGEILPLIEKCTVLITIDISTTILEAQIFEKPVISISVKEYGWGDAQVFHLNPKIKVSLDDFPTHLNKILSDSNFKRQIIEDGNKFVNEYISYQGIASEKLLDFCKNIKN